VSFVGPPLKKGVFAPHFAAEFSPPHVEESQKRKLGGGPTPIKASKALSQEGI